MSDPAQVLKNLKPERDFFVGIDSDGCVFDTMEIKQKECFCPAFINVFGLQPVAKYARETVEFVNLYSKDRGCNRFISADKVLDLIRERREVRARGIEIPAMSGLKEWIKRESKLGNPTLKEELERNPDPDLAVTYRWSIEANEAIEKIVRNCPPFPFARESLKKLREKADAIVVSQTPGHALEREWREHGIDGEVRIIAGQEMGTKTQHLAFATEGKYKPGRVLMIGDAYGDLKAARANKALFFPINPGHEEKSWERFFNEALERFLGGTYAGQYEARLIEEFDRLLPESPYWKK